jgi:hypothetical protein
VTDFGSGESLRGSQRHAERDLQRELASPVLGGVGQCLQNIEAFGEMADRLHVRRALHGLLAGAHPVR